MEVAAFVLSWWDDFNELTQWQDGIFYALCTADNPWFLRPSGIVLKKARMTKRGKSDANVANGELIDTLVILSGDLVQVVTKGVLLPAVGNMSGDRTEAVMSTVSSDECSKNGAKKSSESTINKKKGGRVLMQNGNSFHGVTPTRAGKEHGGRNMPLNHIENASKLENERSDGVNLSEADKVQDTKMTSKLFPFRVSCDPSAIIVQRDIQCCERTTS